MKTTTFSFDDWLEEFQPLYGEDGVLLDIGFKQAVKIPTAFKHYLWTEVEVEDGVQIMPGRRVVNRLRVFVSTVPWVYMDNYSIIYKGEEK